MTESKYLGILLFMFFDINCHCDYNERGGGNPPAVSFQDCFRQVQSFLAGQISSEKEHSPGNYVNRCSPGQVNLFTCFFCKISAKGHTAPTDRLVGGQQDHADDEFSRKLFHEFLNTVDSSLLTVDKNNSIGCQLSSVIRQRLYAGVSSFVCIPFWPQSMQNFWASTIVPSVIP